MPQLEQRRTIRIRRLPEMDINTFLAEELEENEAFIRGLGRSPA